MATSQAIVNGIALIKCIYPYYSKESDAETVANVWKGLFSDIPDDVFLFAIKRSLKVCKTPPTPADIYEQISSMIEANRPSDEELWVTLTEAARKVEDLKYSFRFTMIESNGKTQGQNARDKVTKIWEALPMELKEYLGSKGELMRMGEFDQNDLYYEKKQFMKRIPQISKRMESVGMLGMLSLE